MSYQTYINALAERGRYCRERLDLALKLARFEAPAKSDADRIAQIEEILHQVRMELT